MNDKSGFPKNLLQARDDAKLEYFKRKVLSHKFLTSAFDQAISYINSKTKSRIVFIYGPTGVGKTTLCERIIKHIHHNFKGDPGDIPAVFVEAECEGKKGFDWRDFYISCLQSMDEPFIDKKRDPSLVQNTDKSLIQRLSYRQPSEHALCIAVKSALFHRHPRAVIIDEAHNIKYTPGARSLLTQMKTIKSMANNRLHILVGTYDLLDLTDLCGQLNRRTRDIHFKRYRYDIANELQEYYNVLVNLENHMPLETKPNLSAHLEYIYEKTCGCIGILKDWFMDCLELAIKKGDKSVTIEHLKAKQIEDRKLVKISREIKEGEERLGLACKDTIRDNLGMNVPVKIEKSDQKKQDKKHQKPGTRKPKRDPIGDYEIA